MSPRLVILVHGVNPDRDWPVRTRRVLEPHFRCEFIEYHEYDTNLGPIRAVLPVSALLVVVFLFIAAVISLFWFSWLTSAAILGAFIFCLYCGLLLGRANRHQVLREKYMPQFDHYRGMHGEPPHVIAHSLGTWLTAAAMKLHPTAVYERAIFVGSVVPRRFGWTKLLEEVKPDAFSHLRNEVGTSDWVVLFAGLTPLGVTEMGFGGLRGFSPSPLVHQQGAARGPCAVCQSGSTAPIHNVPLETYRHSDAFLRAAHAAELWLPELWGYQPGELHRFYKLCQAMMRFVADFYTLGVGEAERQLRLTYWSWTSEGQQPHSLDTYLENRAAELAQKHQGTDALDTDEKQLVKKVVAHAVLRMCQVVTAAVQASDPNRALDPGSSRWLNPRIAMHVALLDAVETTPWKPVPPSVGTKS